MLRMLYIVWKKKGVGKVVEREAEDSSPGSTKTMKRRRNRMIELSKMPVIGSE